MFRMRRDALSEADNPAFRRPSGNRQRYRMLIHLFRILPSTPYCTNEKGQGPAWANSLFEDFCEFGLGMYIAYEKMRDRLVGLMQQASENTDAPAEFRTLAKEWLDNREDAKKSRELGDLIIAAMKEQAGKGCDFAESVIALDHCFTKRSQWIIGGDGASYDIGYGVSTM